MGGAAPGKSIDWITCTELPNRPPNPFRTTETRTSMLFRIGPNRIARRSSTLNESVMRLTQSGQNSKQSLRIGAIAA